MQKPIGQDFGEAHPRPLDSNIAPVIASAESCLRPLRPPVPPDLERSWESKNHTFPDYAPPRDGFLVANRRRRGIGQGPHPGRRPVAADLRFVTDAVVFPRLYSTLRWKRVPLTGNGNAELQSEYRPQLTLDGWICGFGTALREDIMLPACSSEQEFMLMESPSQDEGFGSCSEPCVGGSVY